MAISENHIIQENKDFFIKHKIDLESIESNTSKLKSITRSSNALLIKNLNFHNVDKDELFNMFERYNIIYNYYFIFILS